MMKKIVALLLCLVLAGVSVLALAEGDSDKAYVVGKGKLIVGVTVWEPMDYKDADGNWIGFDADMARAFGESLGVEVEFVEIDWDNKILELDGMNIDCVWNGMTLLPAVLAGMNCTKPYMNNSQVVILPADKAADYADVESLAGLTFAVEAGSAGEDVAVKNGFQLNAVQSQAAALMEVAAGTSDAAVIDYMMAVAMTGEGTSYENLVNAIALNDELYGVGFRKGSDLTDELNAFFAACLADGSMLELAKQYGVENALIQE